MSASAIEWTGRSDWNPVRGCTRRSQGCANCYAEQIAGRFSDPGQPFHGFATRTARGGRWTGKVELIEDRLTLPFRWRKPATVFVNSTSDIFHESLPDEAIDRIFAVMALAPQHTFQVLTKRAERMRDYVAGQKERARIGECIVGDGAVQHRKAVEPKLDWPDAASVARLATWPLPNVHLGVSVEDQAAADERVPQLLATPAALRFLSCEPLIGPVDVESWLDRLDWVIAGGESGRNARPMYPAWARSLRDQCAAAGVPFFFKQWGEWSPCEAPNNPSNAYDMLACDGFIAQRTGKRIAGRLLDGRTHDGSPA